MMNNKLSKIKKEYLNLNASEELKERIDNTMKNTKINSSPWKKFAGLAACLCFAFMLSLNVSPALAANVSDLPGMKGIVRILTFNRYIVNEDGFQADVITPKIEGLLDKELEDKLNKDFKDNADAVILAFENDMKELKKQFPNETVHLGVDSGYIVKTDNENIIALDAYMVNTVGSSSTTHKFYTIDKKSKNLLTLPSLFQKDSNYVVRINEYITKEMKRQNDSGENYYWIEDNTFEKFKTIKENQNFYINNDGQIVICFDKYEVGPGSSGCPEFVVPDEVVKDVLK